MQMQQIRVIAKENGIKTGKITKISLIRKIQQIEGNYECFATDVNGNCDQLACLWRDDCFSVAKKQLRQ